MQSFIGIYYIDLWYTNDPVVRASVVEFKFHMETPQDVGTKVCSNSLDHMTKMAAMPIYDKSPLKSSPEPEGRYPWDLACSIWDVGPTKFVQIMLLS